MATLPLIDTNLFVRHIQQDHLEHSARASLLFERIGQNVVRVRCTDTVIFETVFTLQRQYRLPRTVIASAMLPLLALDGIVLPGKRRYRRVFELYITFPVLSFADRYHAALVERARMPGILSFDRGFDRLPGVRRLEP